VPFVRRGRGNVVMLAISVPKSRFLLAGEHVDVWFDESLLNM
jgi:hypothetical protein